MPGELVRYDNFDFKGDTLPLLVDDRGRFASFARVCQVMQLNPSVQWAAIQKHAALAADTRIEFDGATGEARFYLRVEAVPAWLFTIDTEHLPRAVRAKHTAYCRELIQAVYAFTSAGVAVNAAVVGPEAKQQIEAFAKQARAAYLSSAMALNEAVLRQLPDDEMACHNARMVLKRLACEEAAGHARAGSGDGLETLGGLCRMWGFNWSVEVVQRVGVIVSKEYERRYKAKPTKTNQTGRGNQVGAHSNARVPVANYYERDWPWIEIIVRDFAKRVAA